MKQIFVAGNWKSNRTISEASLWLQKWNAKCQISNIKWENADIVLCVPYTLLSFFHDQIQTLKLPIQLGAQDVSPYPSGAYTGEVNARQIKELADWVIIGHSERRKHFGETDVVLAQKVQQAKSEGLKIIYCVPDQKTAIPDEVDVVAYEPVMAIGTGVSEDPELANVVISGIKLRSHLSKVIYGGSVTADNAGLFVSQPAIDGILPGGASLDAEKFYQLIQMATSSCL